MQSLVLQTSWERAIAPQDREVIESLFHETKNNNTELVVFSPIKEAINHKKDLLITVLVHNFSEQTLKFENTKIVYRVEDHVIAKHNFTIPVLPIPPMISMPWTFLFPEGSYSSNQPYESGILRLSE
ncbi:SLAP domain-containing protein [Bacillus sp. B1-b2]|uniref:SLAP domain-containing protein n=1 Tax=Bacillus sp. B1-b2 TaxID=2653201 RepID=UPI0012621ED4|nr:SLAP domain-containing protein [Bacillus sp. B1-b2]KAB7672169.1 SLAP domain-containing protein [Bacillus sp. B1-b2]